MLLLSRIIFSIIIMAMAFFAMHKVWTKNVDIISFLRKPSESIPIKAKATEEPKIKISFLKLPSDYNAGLIIDGITWKKDYKEYLLRIINDSSTDIHDLRINMQLCSVIVHYKLTSQQGSDEVNVFQNYSMSGVGPKTRNAITKTFKSFYNDLHINTVKFFSKGQIEIKLIVKIVRPIEFDGNVETEYKFMNEQGEMMSKSALNIIEVNKDNLNMKIIADNSSSKHQKARIMMVPEKPLIFKKDGTIEIKDE